MSQQGIINSQQRIITADSGVPFLDEREASLAISTGYQGTGKSYQTLYTIKRYLALHPDRKVLIYDVNDEFGYENCVKHGWPVAILKLPPDLNSIQRFTAHQTERIRRIVPIHPNTGNRFSIPEMKNLLKVILENFSRGFLLIEDMNKYLLQTRHIEEIVSILISLRHQNLDAIIHLQSLAKIDPTLWENAKYIRMHWQTDSIDRIESRIPCVKLVKIAKYLVDYFAYEIDTKRFLVWVIPQENKLWGEFSKADFKLAFYRYLKTEKSELRETAAIMDIDIKKFDDRMKVVNYLYKKNLYMYGNPV